MQNTHTAGRPHRNQGLFSDHYLNVTLPARPDWKALTDEARLVMEAIAGLLDSYTPSENEAQVEEDLVRPILRLLSHTFEDSVFDKAKIFWPRMPIVLGMRTTEYFRRSVLEDPDRADITVEMCEGVVSAAEYTNQQENGLRQIWGYVPELDRYIRVITSADRDKLMNAFKDRNFTRRRKREGS
jgi:hypothetical protein